jgi:hypothetical protein
MKQSLWVFALAMSFSCAGKNTVAGAEKTPGEQLDANLPAWCAKTCTWFATCAAQNGCNCSADGCDCMSESPTCEDDCQQELRRFTVDDECAAVGQRFLDCFDALSCVELDSSSCRYSRAERDLCPELDGDGTDAGPPIADTGSGGTSAVPTNTGGSTTSGGAASSSGGASGGSGTGGALVGCAAHLGAAGSAAGGAASSEITCDEGADSCDDGHTYAWLCVRGSQGQIGCSCFVDSQVSGSFDPMGTTCPTMPIVNAGCGWNLAD